MQSMSLIGTENQGFADYRFVQIIRGNGLFLLIQCCRYLLDGLFCDGTSRANSAKEIKQKGFEIRGRIPAA